MELQSGLFHLPEWFDRPAQEALVITIRDILRKSPLFTPVMPKTGQPFSVRMSNCGALGWVSDETGYRYQPYHPVTNEAWPAIPAALNDLWQKVAPHAAEPQACLINLYGPTARMGMHQDRDEEDFTAPVVSVSLGATALFRFGGETRHERTRSIRLASGDVVVIGGASRLCFHGVDRLYPGTSTLVAGDQRINLTLRRVTR